jgi:hypothetical protein
LFFLFLSLSVCEEMDSSLGVCSWRLADCVEACLCCT